MECELHAVTAHKVLTGLFKKNTEPCRHLSVRAHIHTHKRNTNATYHSLYIYVEVKKVYIRTEQTLFKY